MAEPAIKKRVLTKVRRQFLHKGPPEDEDTGNNVSLLTTPEQLNGNAVYILEPSVGLVETNRSLCAGYHFLSPYYTVNNIRVDSQFESRTVTISIKTNEADLLPWEYCVKRLESYGDLELATWASRLKTYHENYPKTMEQYFQMQKLKDPQIEAFMLQEKAKADLACREIENNQAFVKISMYANKNSMLPVAFVFNDKLLKDVGHSPEEFVQWTKEHGFPEIFKRDIPQMMDACKEYLTNVGGDTSFFKEGVDYEVDFYDKEGEKKPTHVKMYFAMDPAPEGFFVNVYITQKLIENSLPNSQIDNGPGICNSVAKQDNDTTSKMIKKESQENEIPANQTDPSSPETE